MIDTNVMATVQNCLDSGVILTLIDGEKLSIKGNKQAMALKELRALVASNRRAVLTAVETVTLQRAANAFNDWNAPVMQEAKPVVAPFVVAPAPVALTQDNFQPDFTLADVDELPIEPAATVATVAPIETVDIDDEPVEPGATDMEIIAMAPERMRSADPNTFIGKVIGPKQFDILAARGRVEGFGIQCEPLSEDILCNWKLIKAWDLAKGYESGVTA